MTRLDKGVERGSATNGLIESLFKAFSRRSLPVADTYWDDAESAAVEQHFKGVLPRQVSFELVESCSEAIVVLPSMKPLTQLYYAPAFMALCVEDYERVNHEPDQILHWFRFWPFEMPETHDDGDPGAAFRLSVPYSPDELQHLQKWYFEGFEPQGNVYVAASTDAEKRAFVSFLEFLESHRPLEYALDGWLPASGRALYAAKALLRGESLPRRLGAVSKHECRSLLGALDTLQSKYPRSFPKRATRPIMDALAGQA